MYLPLSSALDLMFLAWLGLVLLTGIMWWRRAVGRKWLVTMTLLVLAIGFGSTSLCKHVAVGSLEWQFPPRTEPLALHQVIVVLGGDILRPDQGRPEADLAESTLMRCLTAARLYRESGPHTIISSDGAMYDTRGIQVADVMRDFMRTQQIDATDLIVETESRSTYENAVGVAPYLKENNPPAESCWLPMRCTCGEHEHALRLRMLTRSPSALAIVPPDWSQPSSGRS
jgi:uncharacterized SAM-binding protein YcdF (DUF218 family)